MVPNGGVRAVLRATVSAPQIEYGIALGTGEATPRLSWKIDSTENDWSPDRYEVTLWREDAAPEIAINYSVGQVFEEWPFAPLVSRERYEVAVRVGSGKHWSEQSARAAAEVGLLSRSDWVADFVSPVSFGGLDDAAPVVFTQIELSSVVVSARLYVTAKGLYEFSINGSKVGLDALTPGWTAYEKRIRYQTYDVTAQLRPGSNVLRGLLGNGWYRGQLVWPGNRDSYGSRLALIAQLEVKLSDGSQRVFATGDSWLAAESGILFDDLYDGQTRDQRASDMSGLQSVQRVEVLTDDVVELVAPTAAAVVVTETVKAVSVIKSPTGKLIVDFGQNLVGWVKLIVRDGPAGSEVTIRHAEVLEYGELGVRPLRSAKATSRYFLAGLAEETLLPTFTFHGFRYAEITGVDNVHLADVDALVLGSGMQRTGWFDSSSAALNQLHQNVVWSMRGNFLDIPTDCPARDERLGWTGDIQVFAPTANFLYNTSGFLGGWLRELAAEQKPDGGVPNVIPDVLRDADPASAAWGDAATIVPSAMFDAFADRGLLARQYGSMVAWVNKVSSIVGPRLIWDEGEQFGDWLDPTAPHDDPSRAQADPAVVATAYFARSTSLLAHAAEVLGLTSDSAKYRSRHHDILRAFRAEYVSEAGVVRSDCQTVYALALQWDLLESVAQRDFASARLADLVKEAGYRVSTGFVGTPLIMDALETAGHPELAMSMLMQDETPSWLYSVKMGATTVWERWDSMLPDGSINPGTMTSFNHYAYGAIADWMHRRVAGLEAIEPGYRRIRVRPNLTGHLTSASAGHDSPYGRIDVSWSRADKQFYLEVSIPFGVRAEVWLPGAKSPEEIRSGKQSFRVLLA